MVFINNLCRACTVYDVLKRLLLSAKRDTYVVYITMSDEELALSIQWRVCTLMRLTDENAMA